MKILVAMFALMLVSAGPAGAQPASTPDGMIRAIYRTYEIDDVKGTIKDVASRRLKRLIEADEKATPKGEIGKLDFDVFVNGNDFKVSRVRVRIQPPPDDKPKVPDRAKVQATFISLKKPHEIVFDLVREGGQWKIDDATSTIGEKWTLTKILTGKPEATGAGKK
jgi:hypothetical protein